MQYVFRVNLKRSKGVWRTLALRGDHTLHDLHEMIFRAFDRFDDEHMYSFYFPRAQSRRSAGSIPPKEYTSPVVFEEPRFYRDEGVLDAGEAVGRALSMLVNVLNPELVVVGGDLAPAGAVLLDPMRAAIERHGVAPAAGAVRVMAGTLGDRAEVLGAVGLDPRAVAARSGRARRDVAARATSGRIWAWRNRARRIGSWWWGAASAGCRPA